MSTAPTLSFFTLSTTVSFEQKAYLFSGAAITDVNPGAQELVTIAYSGDGVLSGSSALHYDSTDYYTLTGTASAVAQDLADLTFTPPAGALNSSTTTDITVTDYSMLNGAVVASGTPQTVTVTDSDVPVPPTIEGTYDDIVATAFQGPAAPFAKVTINDPDPYASVEYFHVELDAHDILLAEGLPAESYLDCGNRADFANGGAFVTAHPDFKPKNFAETCLPLVSTGAQVERTRALLSEILRARGLELTADAAPLLCADGAQIAPLWQTERRLAFRLPEGRRDIVLKSEVFTPAEVTLDSADDRVLGLCVARLQIDGDEVALDSEDLSEGWHEVEREAGAAARRWTDGAARLPAGARVVIVDLGGAGLYWRGTEDSVVALFG